MPLNLLSTVDAFQPEDMGEIQARKTQQAMAKLQAGETVRTLRNRDVMEELARTTQDPGAMAEQYQSRTGDFAGAEGLRGTAQKNHLAQLETGIKAIDFARKSAELVKANPAAYPGWRQNMIAAKILGAEGFPEQYDQAWMEQLTTEADAKLKEFNILIPGGKQKQLIMRGDKALYEGPEVERFKPSTPRQTKTVEIYDPDSPSGTRIVSVDDAIGQPGKLPAKAFSITGYDSEGRPLMELGGSGAPMGTAARNKVEEKLIDSGDTLSQITAIRAKFKPEYQSIARRWDAVKSSWKSKAGMDLPQEERQRLRDFSAYRAEAGQMFSQTLKTLSGAAVTAPEMKRAEAWLPNPGTGLVDGDDPETLAAKIERLEDFTKKALAKNAFIRRNGLSPEDIDIERMPALIRQRGDELAAELASRGVQGEQLKSAVKQRLADEFGIGMF